MTSAVARHCISPRCWYAPAAGLVHPNGATPTAALSTTDSRSLAQRAQTKDPARPVPGGAVLLWGWDADPDFDEQAGEQRLVLLPSKWNPTTHRTVYSWRLP